MLHSYLKNYIGIVVEKFKTQQIIINQYIPRLLRIEKKIKNSKIIHNFHNLFLAIHSDLQGSHDNF